MDVYIVCLLIMFTQGIGSLANDVGKHIVEQALSEDLSSVPPSLTGSYVDISMQVFFSQMRSGTPVENVDFTFYLYQVWADPRLQWGNGTEAGYYVVRPNLWKNIWLPDTYIENELKSFIHDISSQNKFIWVMKNGTVIYGLRLTATLSCKFGAMKFPTAYFVCKMKFRVHSYENKDVRLDWFNKSIDFADDFEGDNINMVGFRTKNCTLDRSSVIINSCLEMRMLLKKSFGSTILRTYLPSIFIIIVGWLSFWIDRKEVSARVKLGTLVLLAMITEEVGITLITPALVSALDIWFAVLLTYVTLVMIEFAVVHSIDRYQKKLKLQREERDKATGMDNLEEMNNSVDNMSNHPDDLGSKKKIYKMHVDQKTLMEEKQGCFLSYISTINTGKIEKYARVIYIVSFFIFQIVYWSYYLTHIEVIL